ncbi:MAG: Gfo/Idh/MocA family oxidoreductase [Treponema sp.]|nr:Gfo/Idh/MocA family oxidoreductase [Treponema sp.]
MGKLQVLLAGIGGYGAQYLGEFLDRENASFELAGVADPFAASSPRYGELEARSVPVFKTPEEFYAVKKADLAVISSPIHTHYPYMLTCFENRSSILCEKPATGSLKELDELIALEKSTALFAAVGFQLCFSRDVQALKKDILNGLFGKPLEFKALRFPRRGTKYYRRNGWAGKLSFDGRVILDSPLQNACAHEMQVMLFLLGETMNRCASVSTVEAELWQARPDIENYDAAAVRLTTGPRNASPRNASSGVKVLFFTAHCIEESTPGPVGEFHFEKALVRWGETSNEGFTAYFNDGRKKSYDETDKGKPLQKLYDVIEAVQTGIPPVCTLETARPHLQCVTMVQQYPVKKIPQEKLAQGRAEDGDVFYYVPGLAAAFSSAYEKNLLPSEAGFTL